MDLTLDDNDESIGWRVWLTGHVRESDGSGYDVATISYLVPSAGPSPNEVLTPYLPTTSEKGVAVTANVRDVYVTASIQPPGSDTGLILTFKIRRFGTPPGFTYYDFDWMRLFGNGISDISSAITAPTPISGGVAVFVAGKSLLPTTSHDQASLRYTEPP
ncbi:MAG: hypothetical protein IIB55_09055 [Planctomycetes bacterium]|nr:hypothetical protein [Planctomycetota bacterium]